jgi:hypothetical protein
MLRFGIKEIVEVLIILHTPCEWLEEGGPNVV